jgi:hypothetical protein
MRKILVSTSVLLALTLAPALAKDKNKLISIDDVRDAERAGKKFLEEQRALERYEEKVDRLQGRLDDAGDDERQRIENIIESVTEKYEAKWGELPEEPPPVEVELFKDDFQREDSRTVGNGWEGSGVISDGRLSMDSADSRTTRVDRHFDLGGEYTNLSVSFDMWADPNRPNGQTIVSLSVAGGNFIPLSTYTGASEGHETLLFPSNASAFDLRFEVEGSRQNYFDNVTVTGTPLPTAEPFVGY